MEVIFEQYATSNYDNDGILGDLGGTDYQQAESFSLTYDSIITGIKAYLKTGAGSPTGDVTVRIETDSAGSPSGTLAHANATGTISASGITSSIQLLESSMTAFPLSASTTYWIVINVAAQSNDNYFSIGRDTSSAGYAGTYKYKPGASAWTTEATTDLIFQLLGTVQYIKQGTTSYTMPTGAIAVDVECLGGGGGGGNNERAGGGGGAYSKISALTITAGNSYTCQVGAGGAAGAPGSAGTDTYFNGASLAASSCGSKGGSGGDVAAASGGSSASGVGATKYSGGNSAADSGSAGDGGTGAGGAAGPNGAGNNGSANSVATGGAGGSGDNGSGGAGGSAGSVGNAGGAGGAGTEWDANHGSGGGGGGGANLFNGGAAGLYGAGGGGGGTSANGIAGANGLIVLTFVVSAASQKSFKVSQAVNRAYTY